MKRKYYWEDGVPQLNFILLIAMVIIFVCISIRSFPASLVVLFPIGLGVYSLVSWSRLRVVYLDDVIHVRRSDKQYSIPTNKINKIVISVQYIAPGTSGLNRLMMAVDRECGHFIGNGRRMLRAILKIYPNIPIVVMYSGWRLGKKNAILLAQRGYLSEEQLKEVQKRYRLPEGFEKVD